MDEYTKLFKQTVEAFNQVLRLLVLQDSEPNRFKRMWLAEEMRHQAGKATWYGNELADLVRDEESTKKQTKTGIEE